MSNIPGYLGARQLALQAGAAQGRRNALPLMLQVYGAGHDFRVSDTARVHANRERDEARAFRADELDQNREADYALELLKQEGRAGLQGERIDAMADRQTERIDAAQVGREITASTARLRENLKAERRSPAEQEYERQQTLRAGEQVGRKFPLLSPSTKPGQRLALSKDAKAEERQHRTDDRIERVAGAQAAARGRSGDQRDRALDQGDRSYGLSAIKAAETAGNRALSQHNAETRSADAAERHAATLSARGQQFDMRRWDAAMAKARDEAAFIPGPSETGPGQRPGRDTPEYQEWLEKRAQEFYDSAPQQTPDRLNSMLSPVLPPEVMAAFGNSTFAAIDKAPPSPPIDPRQGTFVRDEATGRTVTPDNVRDTTSLAIDRLKAKHPAVRLKALQEMQADPERFRAMGIDVQAVLDIAGSE